MTFLHPILLWGLPAALLPVLIHLLNRLRFRSVRWAAMMFLVAATRSSTKRARLRHYLILLCRTLVILLLLLALSRPTVGGWLGGSLAGAPDTVIILLDRSASMEATDPRRQCSKREHALKLFAQAATESAASSRFVLIENVFRTPQEIASPSVLTELELASATDTAADIPAMFQAALDYMIMNKSGRTEIWVASDLQASNWYPERQEWQNLSAQIAALPQDVRVRLLALCDGYKRNVSVALHRAQRQGSSEHPRLGLTLDIHSSASRPDVFPMIITLDGTRSQIELELDTPVLNYHRQMALSEGGQVGGWGKVEIPADENPRDNTCYFVYGDDIPLRTVVVSDSPLPATTLRLATAPSPGLFNRFCEIISARDADTIAWRDLAMLIWQAPAPGAEMGAAIQTFVANGGTVVSFPPGRSSATEAGANQGTPLFGAQWDTIETAESETPFRVPLWEEHDGPLANTDGGLSLRLDSVSFFRRQGIAPASATNAAWTVLARYADGKPFLLRHAWGAGRAFICTSLPREDWSTLGQGTVLVPMLQRILQHGGQRLARAETAYCGEWRLSDPQEVWTSVESGTHKNPQWQAGVYQCGARRVALNRPPHEDIPDGADAEHIKTMFGDVSLQVLDDLSQRDSKKLQSEIWRLFLCLSLACMLAESGLLLSNRLSRDKSTATSKTS